MIPLADIDVEILARARYPLHRLVRMAWSQIEPGQFRDNWHIGAICERLEAVSAGEVKRLVINIPPGCGKSLAVSVFWPLWEWIERPTTKWMYASFDGSLARRDSARMLRIIQSEWWRERWPHVEITETKPAATNYENTAGGFRFATSVEGKATGRHVDVQVVDDPIKPRDVSGSAAVSGNALSLVSAWWRETMSSRRSDPETFRRVIVMQRLHEDDLAGEMIRDGGYEHLCLPMRWTPVACVCGKPCTPEDKRRTDGELLWPEHHTEDAVRELEVREMGPSVAAAQLQQRPSPLSGAIIKRQWFRYWHKGATVRAPRDDSFPCRDELCRQLPDAGVWLQSWDLAFKGGDGSDFVAGGVWLYVHPDAYLVHQVCARMSFVESCAAVLDVSARYPRAITKLIEDKANGPALEDTLRGKTPGLVLVNPEGGKEARAHAISGLFEAGNVYLPHPELASWVPEYRAQMCGFPRMANDDMVDQTSQALIRLTRRRTPLVEAMRAFKAETTATGTRGK